MAEIHDGYAMDNFKRAFLKVYTPDGDRTKYALPKDVVQFFHMPIQKLFRVKPEIKVYLPEEFAASLDDENRFIAENKRKITLAGVHLDFLDLLERYYVENRPVDEEYCQIFTRNFNNWLLFSKLCVKNITVKKSISAMCRDFDVCLTVKCHESFVWTFYKNIAMSNPGFLFSEMKKRCITHYTIENDEALYLGDRLRRNCSKVCK